MFKAIGLTLGLLLSVVIFIIFRTGYFKPVEIGSGYQGPFYLVYNTHRGPYHEIAPMLDQIEEQLIKQGFGCPIAFGRFLHDPETVPHDRLESHGGCAFPSPTPKLLDYVKSSELTGEALEKTEYLVATFTGSPSIGPFKVYPEVKQWMSKYGYKIAGPVIELYQTTGEDSLTTRYLFKYE